MRQKLAKASLPLLEVFRRRSWHAAVGLAYSPSKFATATYGRKAVASAPYLPFAHVQDGQPTRQRASDADVVAARKCRRLMIMNSRLAQESPCTVRLCER